MNYYGSEYQEKKVLDYINWAYTCNGVCTLSELNDRFKSFNALEVCSRLEDQGKIKREGLFQLSFSIIPFDRKTCQHRIPASMGRAHKESTLQKNALRVETIGVMDRCSLKMPAHWSQAARDRAWNDIVNGFVLDFGYCSGNCPEV